MFLDTVPPLKAVVAPVSPTAHLVGVSPWYRLPAVSPAGSVGVELSPVAGLSSVTLVGVVLDSRSGKLLVKCFSPRFGLWATV